MTSGKLRAVIEARLAARWPAKASSVSKCLSNWQHLSTGTTTFVADKDAHFGLAIGQLARCT